MNAIRINTHIDSETLHLPQLREWIGRDVEIIVQPQTNVVAASPFRYPLRGSVLRFDDPMTPIVASDWDALR